MANQQVGVLWQRKSQEKGTVYFSGIVSLGVLGQCNVVCFKNDRDGKGENAPDWIMYTSEPRPQNGSGGSIEADDDVPF